MSISNRVINKRPQNNKLTDEQKDELVKSYIPGQTTSVSLAKKYGIHKSSVKGLLRRRGVELYNVKNKKKRQYKLNDNLFENIDTEEKAYFLGLMYADGYNDKYGRGFAIALQEQDFNILIKFNLFLQTDRPLSFYKKKNKNHSSVYKLICNSKKMSQDLSLKGCGNKKSLTLQFPTEDQVPKHLIRHFIRGYFDGDGCFSTYQTKNLNNIVKRYNISIVATRQFAKRLSEICDEFIQVPFVIYKKPEQKCIRWFQLSGRKSCYKFLEWIYQDATVYLYRKHDKFTYEKSLFQEVVTYEV